MEPQPTLSLKESICLFVFCFKLKTKYQQSHCVGNMKCTYSPTWRPVLNRYVLQVVGICGGEDGMRMVSSSAIILRGTFTYAQWGRGSRRYPWLQLWVLGRWRTVPSWRKPSILQSESPGCFPQRCGSSTGPWWVHAWQDNMETAISNPSSAGASTSRNIWSLPSLSKPVTDAGDHTGPASGLDQAVHHLEHFTVICKELYKRHKDEGKQQQIQHRWASTDPAMTCFHVVFMIPVSMWELK